MKKIGLFIGRMQPPHKGHTSVIKRALSENDQVLVLLGDSGVQDKNNPLTFEQRKTLLEQYFIPSLRLKGRCPQDGGGNEKFSKLSIDIIKDRQTDKEWVQNITNALKDSFGENIELNIYGGDFQKDSAILAIKQYESLLGDNINYIPVDRFLETVNYKGEEVYISATNLRNALRNGDREFVEKFCNKEIVEEIVKYFK